MENEKLAELARLMEWCVFHSELKGGYIVSGVPVLLPVQGQMEHMICLERRIICETARDARMEEESAIRILSNTLSYLIDGASTFEKPVYQEGENGIPTPIGVSVIFIDRGRIAFPKLVVTETEIYLDCTGEKSDQKAD